MHVKRRGTRAMLYRSTWIAKGANNNTHGYAIQTFVGSLPVNAQCLPADIAGKVTEEEVIYLEAKLFLPARLAILEKERAAEHREADPLWRLDEAARLALEAATRSESGAVPVGKVAAVQAALLKVRTITRATVPTAARFQVQDLSSEQAKSDPLRDALNAIKAARDAVTSGRYGRAPAEGVRASYPYRVWAKILQAVEGSGDDSLMRALQARGFAKTRGK